MFRLLFLIALGLSPAAPAAAYNAAPGAGLDMIAARFASDPGPLFTDIPACITRIFAVGEAPTNPSQIAQITCLDAMCTQREVLLCANRD
jgi:hypothetical protein